MGGVVRRYTGFLIILLIPTPLVLALFVAASQLLCSFKKKCFFVLYNYTSYNTKRGVTVD